MGKNKNKNMRVWFIHNQDKTGYWSDMPEHFLTEFQEMSPDDKFEITCKDMTEKEFEKLEKTSHEFEGW